MLHSRRLESWYILASVFVSYVYLLLKNLMPWHVYVLATRNLFFCGNMKSLFKKGRLIMVLVFILYKFTRKSASNCPETNISQ